MKKLVTLLLVFVMAATCFVGCKRDKDSSGNGTPTYDGYLDSFEDHIQYLKHDLDNVMNAIGEVDGGEIDAKIEAAYQAGLASLDAATSASDAAAKFAAAKAAMAECIPLADGNFNYSGLSQDEKTEVLGLLEAYAVRTGITGTTLFENGSYVLYSDRVTLGTENYIPGYGFGVLAEGNLTAPLATEQNEAWKMYYHSINASDPGTMNYLNDEGSEVGDFYGYIGASYYTTFMNATKDGYDWVPELAASDVEPVGELVNDQTATWRFEIREGLKYNTLGKRTAYNGRAVQPEDFITPFKLLLNQANQYFRGSELSNQTGASAIAGAKAYYDSTRAAPKGILADADYDFSGVGVKVYEENDKWYFEYTLGAPVNAFYARYYISSSLYMPVPADFIAEVGVDNYLGYNQDKTETPVDNSLSLGSYTVEKWDSQQQVVYKKNPYYVYADTKYAIAGIHINILPAAKDDQEAGIKEFLAGKTDASGIPETYLAEYVSDPRARKTTGDSCFKLNFNALDQETWVEIFGENGSQEQTPEEDYWECEPALANSHFRSALSYAINRNEFAASKGYVSSVNYFSSNYMSDPVKNISYNLTEAHQKAVAPLLEGTDSGGYSLELAREYFRLALEELEAAGKYEPGTPENPRVIEIQIAWQYAQHEDSQHKYIKQYWEDAFNHESVHGGCYKLEVSFWVGEDWADVYYKKMMMGQFDIGFGSISGNPLDPLAFMNVCSSDKSISSDFTLNWGADTNDPDSDIIVYNGMRWSYDALWSATQAPTVVKNGRLVPVASLGESSFTRNENGVAAELTVNVLDGYNYSKDALMIFGYVDVEGEAAYYEVAIDEYLVDTVVGEGTVTYKLQIPASVYASFIAGKSQGVDIYWSYDIDGAEVSEAFGGTFAFDFVPAE